MLEGESISQTPFIACLRFRGAAFAWFYDSNLAIRVANELLAVNLIADIQLYYSASFNGFDLDSLHDQSQWCYINYRSQSMFISYHKSIRVSEAKMIGRIIDQTIVKFKEYEKCYY